MVQLFSGFSGWMYVHVEQLHSSTFLLFDLSPQILLVTYISVWPLFHSVNVVYTMCIRIRVMNGKMWENFCVTTQMTSLLNPSISLDMIFYVNEMIFIFTDWYSNYVRFDFYRLMFCMDRESRGTVEWFDYCLGFKL